MRKAYSLHLIAIVKSADYYFMDTNIITDYLVFRTSLQNPEDIDLISDAFNRLNVQDWHVDLNDWEKILRVKNVGLSPEQIIEILLAKGYFIEELTD